MWSPWRLGAPVMTIAIKRLTSDADRTVSFGIFYAMMNVAALISGFAIDGLRLGLPQGLSPGDPTSVLASPVRVVVFSTVFSSIVALLVSLRFREMPPPPPSLGGGRVRGGGGANVRGGVASGAAAKDPFRHFVNAIQVSFKEAYHLPAATLLKDRRFWQFLAMALFTLNLKQIFRHMVRRLPRRYTASATTGRTLLSACVNYSERLAFAPHHCITRPRECSCDTIKTL